jgi:hypothetical protein
MSGSNEQFGRAEPYARTISCGLQITF